MMSHLCIMVSLSIWRPEPQNQSYTHDLLSGVPMPAACQCVDLTLNARQLSTDLSVPVRMATRETRTISALR